MSFQDKNSKRAKKTSGLRYWMTQVLAQCDKVAADFNSDSVHDLRVALRRCRSMADGLMAMIPDPAWKKMKKAGKRLFQRLGDLRDTHIMLEWIEKLEPADRPTQGGSSTEDASSSSEQGTNREDAGGVPGQDTVAVTLSGVLRGREAEQQKEAQTALEEFDRKQWEKWSRSLPQFAARIRPGRPLSKHLALERWTEARALHSRALRSRSPVALHRLRIGLKRFRYIVENFLPAEHVTWIRDLKEMQDLLGEGHDLDVLWNTAIECNVFSDARSKQRWQARIREERAKRIDRYRRRTTGPDSLWQIWREGLPQGKQIQRLATQRMKLWAKTLDPDFAHSERVAELALELYDGLGRAGWLRSLDGVDARSALYAASLLHDVGKTKGEKGHHKESFKMIKEHGSPLGWKPNIIPQAAVIARFHRGALPRSSHMALRDLNSEERKQAIQLAAILRLANAMDAGHDGHIRRVEVKNANGSGKPACIQIAAEGFSARNANAQAVAAERYLLETILRRPVMIAAASGLRRPAAGKPQTRHA